MQLQIIILITITLKLKQYMLTFVGSNANDRLLRTT